MRALSRRRAPARRARSTPFEVRRVQDDGFARPAYSLYVAGYSSARIGEELLRVEPAHQILGLRLNLYVASVLCLGGLAWFIRIQPGGAEASIGKSIGRGGALLAAGGLLALAGCGEGTGARALGTTSLSPPSLVAQAEQRPPGESSRF